MGVVAVDVCDGDSLVVDEMNVGDDGQQQRRSESSGARSGGSRGKAVARAGC